YCDAPHESYYEATPSCSIDVSIEEAFHFPQKISTRLPTETSNSRQITLTNLKRMWCRLVSHYFEWVGGVPELRLMDVRERIKLVTRQLCKIICLTISFWTYQRGHDGLILGSGICFNPKENQDEVIRNYVNSLASVIHTHVISTFRRIGLTREEYLLLKLVVLFERELNIFITLDVYFLPADRLIMESALTKYRSALVSHVKCSHPDLDHEAVLQRILALLGALPYLEILSQLDNMHLADMILRNNGNMQGRLTNEIHLNSIRID
ncbi:Ligand-binding domain of nuclear hormone receptor, partial [Ancylostoma caninum]